MVWSKSRVDPYTKVMVGKHELYRRHSESYCLVGANLLVFGQETALRAVLVREEAPRFSTALAGALKDADLSATIVFAFDVADIREKRRGDAVPFIPGMHMVKAEEATESLALTAKFGEAIEVYATAQASATNGSETTLKDEAARFAAFHTTILKNKRNAPANVLAIFNLNIGSEKKRVTATSRFGAASFAHLLKLLAP